MPIPIQRTAAPGGVDNLLCYVYQQAPPSLAEGEKPVLTTQVEPSFWQQLFTAGHSAWPAIKAGLVRVAEVPEGCLFTVEDEQGLLVVGGVGIKDAGQAWENLSETVGDFRRQAAESVQQSPGGKELTAHWEEQFVPPAGGDWLALVPMIGLRYYGPDAKRIMQLAGGLGNDLLRICNRKAVTA